ncbi:hypothetical protein SLEP1_g42222 [Rubroshorea leprosula]|uniref:Uncharacterized protein n=1 Tax=Rubroshorea leprosula TaxID=152421 RepID=A0AAV5LA20_9ROSI|nr:hypothetical protein SLEP1_g42222 [Rubroshorea leprosula]
MALQIHTPSSPHKPYRRYLPYTPFFVLTKSRFAVKTQKPIVDSEPVAEPPPPKKVAAPG